MRRIIFLKKDVIFAPDEGHFFLIFFYLYLNKTFIMENSDSEKNKLEELIRIQKQIEENLKYLENNYQDLTNSQIQQLTDLMREAEDSLTSEDEKYDSNNDIEDIDLDKI